MIFHWRYSNLSEEEQLVVNERIETMQTKLNKELDTQTEGSRIYNLSRNCIYGMETAFEHADRNMYLMKESKFVNR